MCHIELPGLARYPTIDSFTYKKSFDRHFSMELQLVVKVKKTKISIKKF